jgi:uroporphyrinogen decarboxylase
MRQAGRYLPEYRELREKYEFLSICRDKSLIIEASLQPWQRFKMDAVIVFSDILLSASAMGPKIEFRENTGPKLEYPVQTKKDLDRLRIPNVRLSFPFLLDAMQDLKQKLNDDAALIGFAGAPWTIAAYMIEGESSDFKKAKQLMKESPEFVCELMNKITPVLSQLAVEQVRSGADVVQIFDTWGGLLSPQEYRQYELPLIQRITSEVLKLGAPVILYVKDSANLLNEMIDSGASVLGIGSGTDIKDAIAKIGAKAAIQGNLNAEILLCSPSIVSEETQRLLDEVSGKPGFILNLGHGVLPDTPLESVRAFVETAKSQVNHKHCERVAQEVSSERR